MSLLSSSSAKRPWQSSTEVEKIAPNQNGSKLRGRAKLDEESLAFDKRSHLAYGLIADQISAPVLSAPTDLLREQIRWSTAPTVLGQTEPAEPPNRTPDPAAPSDLVLLLGTNRMRPGIQAGIKQAIVAMRRLGANSPEPRKRAGVNDTSAHRRPAAIRTFPTSRAHRGSLSKRRELVLSSLPTRPPPPPPPSFS